MKTFKYIFTFMLLPVLATAQKDITISLEQCIDMASEQSLDAFLAKNTYLADYWDYRSFKASRLPSLHLNTSPISYNNGISQVWDSEESKYTSQHSQTLNSSAEIQLQQKIGLTGGTFSVETGNRFLTSYSNTVDGTDIYGFTSTPISISFKQDLNGYNALKWRSKIDPERYEMAKRTYLEERESLNIKAINYFFNLVSSQIDLDINNRNYTNAQELFKIGKGRFEVGTITQDALLTLELDVYNSQLAQIRAEQDLLRARIDLNIFLNIDKETQVTCIVPENIPGISITVDEGIEWAMTNNPKMSNFLIRDMQSERDVKQAKAENRFTSSVNVSYGLNGNYESETTPYKETFTKSYQNLGEKQSINVAFNIPIIDWGEGKGAVAVAKSQREVELIKIQQERIAFEQDVTLNILEYNLQKAQVQNSAIADTIAQKGYNISYEIFKLGKLDVIKLNQARTDQVKARKAYITSLENYWKYWFTIRQLTLFDFNKKISLAEDFDKLLDVK